MKLLCKGQFPRFENAVIFPELGYKSVGAGEVIEVTDAQAKVLLKKYPQCLSLVEEVEAPAEKPKKKRFENSANKELPEDNLFTKDFT
jgi:hypothetical protein